MRELAVDVAVVGAGSGGLSVAAGAAQLGLTVALFERGRMGGDCLNTGCVPSKALIAAANSAAAASTASRLGAPSAATVDFAAVMRHVRNAIATIEPHDSQARFEGLGVTVVREAARFVGRRTLAAGDLQVRARKIVLATGSRPTLPPIPGLAETPHLTNETIFDLSERPQHLLVVGGGPIGVELGQAFRRLGAAVTIVEAAEPLAHEDRDIVRPLLEQLAADGVALVEGAKILHADRAGAGVRLRYRRKDDASAVEGSHLLVAAGRAPNLEALDLAAGGVAFDEMGVRVDEGLRSLSNRAVYAVGDVAGRGAFTHLAGAHAALVVRRLAFGLPGRADRLVVPRVTYTDPEVASVGLTESQARACYGGAVRTVTSAFADNDRAVAEGDVRGLAKLVAGRRGRILGVGVVGPHAGELILPWVLALQAGAPLSRLAGVVAPYPTRSEISKRLAGAWFSPMLFAPRTRALVTLLKRLA